MALPPFMQAVATLLARHRFRYTSEVELHEALEAMLRRSDYFFAHEVRLGMDRLDFLLDNGVGLEVKVARRAGAASVRRQLERYARWVSVEGLILVTDRSQLARDMPAVLHGKPLHVHHLRSGLA